MDFNTETLESLCELVVDCPHSTPKWTDSGIIVLRNQNIKNGVLDLSNPSFTTEEDYQKRVKRAIPRAGDIVITREAPMGEVCIIPEGLKCCLGQRQVLLRPRNEICGEYLFWALQSPYVQHQISWNEGTGTTVSNVRIPVLKALMIPRLPKHEKQSAKILSVLASKLEVNQKTNQTLEQMAQALFKSWFVDFDPVFDNLLASVDFNLDNLETSLPDELILKAQRRLAALNSLHNATECKASLSALAHELRAQLPTKAPTTAAEQVSEKAAETPVKANVIANPKILAQHANTHAHFPNEFEHNEQLGWIPKGWVTKPFGELLENTIGGDWGKEFADEKHTIQSRIIRGTDIPALKSGGESKSPLRWVEEKKLKTRKIEFADIIIEISGGSPTQPTGRSIFMSQGIIKRLGGIIEPASFCRRFRPLNKKLGLLASAHLQKIYDDGKTWEYQNQSTGISNFQTKIFLENEVVLIPDNKVLGLFYNIVINFIDRKDLEESEVLTKLRDTLLPKLISGELQIPDVATDEEVVN